MFQRAPGHECSRLRWAHFDRLRPWAVVQPCAYTSTRAARARRTVCRALVVPLAFRVAFDAPPRNLITGARLDEEECTRCGSCRLKGVAAFPLAWPGSTDLLETRAAVGCPLDAYDCHSSTEPLNRQLSVIRRHGALLPLAGSATQLRRRREHPINCRGCSRLTA